MPSGKIYQRFGAGCKKKETPAHGHTARGQLFATGGRNSAHAMGHQRAERSPEGLRVLLLAQAE